MAILTVAGVDIPVALDGNEEEWTEIGDRGVAVGGEPSASVRGRKRSWSFKTPALPPATVETIRAALLSAPKVAASGTVLGGTVDVFPVLGAQTPILSSPFTETQAFTLDEA